MENVQTTTAFDPSQWRWVRSTNGWLAGVCQGLADSFDIEVWILRTALVVGFLWFGIGLVVYFLAAICLPRKDKLDRALQRRVLGVCSRIAIRYDFEVGLVRLFVSLLALSSLGLTLLLYVVAAILMPKQEEMDSHKMSGR